MGKLLIAAACLLLIQANPQAQDPAPDPIAVKITAAKDAFYAERDKAEQALIVLLEKKEAAAKQAGDLKSLETARAELDAFRKEGKLPRIVQLNSYYLAMKQARAKLELSYKNAVIAYTRLDRVEDAKAMHIELELLTHPLQGPSLWKSESEVAYIAFSGKNGETIQGNYHYYGPSDETAYDFTGKVNQDKIEWRTSEVKIIKGKANFSKEIYEAKIIKDNKGYKFILPTRVMRLVE